MPKHKRVTDLKLHQLLTVGREFHPAPKIGIKYFDLNLVYIKYKYLQEEFSKNTGKVV
jgi:hypothetical protein